MKPIFKKFLLAAASLTLAATAATAAPWPPSRGDLLLGVQATGSTGATTNVFFNLGPAHALRDNPSPAGVLVNLDDELTAAFGAGWAARTDLYFGVIGVKSKNPPIGLGAVAPENGDPARTIYVSRGTTTPGASTPWSGFSVSALGSAANNHHGQVDGDTPAINHSSIVANGDGVATVSQSANPTQWNNSWKKWNPVPGPAFEVFTGGIQARMGNSSNHVDLHRIVSTSSSGSYVTTVTIAGNGDVTAARAGAAARYFNITTSSINGSVAGGGTGILYAAGTTARLTALPSTGYGLMRWTGKGIKSSANPLNFVVDGSKTVTAIFGLLPSISSPTATSFTSSSALLGANVASVGNGKLVERGIIYTVESNSQYLQVGLPNVSKATIKGSRGVFRVPVTGLTAATTYAYRGFITSSIGTSYTDVSFFTTNTPVNFTNRIGSVSNRRIRAGESQTFEIGLPDSSIVNFSGIGASASSAWELRNASGVVIGTGTGNLVFTQPIARGNYRLRLTNGGASTETVSLNFNGTNLSNPRPDISVGTAATATTGANVYDPSPQLLTQTTTLANPREFFFLIGNDGVVPDSMKVSGTAGNTLFKTKYMVPALRNKNITAAVITGTYTTSVMASGDAPLSIKVQVSPNKLDTRIKERRLISGKFRTFYYAQTFNGSVRVTPSSDSDITDTANYRLNAQAN